MASTSRIDIRLTEELKQMLKEIAEHDSRSITKEIEWLIKERYKELQK
jgi:hypothetical protein